MKKIFCVHVPMFISRLMEVECVETDGEFVPVPESAQEVAQEVATEAIAAYSDFYEAEGGNDAWRDTDRPIGLSHALGNTTIASYRELDDCDGIEYEFQ